RKNDSAKKKRTKNSDAAAKEQQLETTKRAEILHFSKLQILPIFHWNFSNFILLSDIIYNFEVLKKKSDGFLSLNNEKILLIFVSQIVLFAQNETYQFESITTDYEDYEDYE
uniref:Uncharacterized protein n=1 Tax=Romanomermis culicivorax TaxID=13658 RepID=A0A915L3E6_ROMCU